MTHRPERVRMRTGMARAAYNAQERRARRMLAAGYEVEVSVLFVGRGTTDDAVLMLNTLAASFVDISTADDKRVMAREVLVTFRPDREPPSAAPVPARPKPAPPTLDPVAVSV